MRGAPFLGWILVRGVWCADFEPISVHGASFLGSLLVAVRRFWARFWCAVYAISVHGAPFWARKIGKALAGIEPETCRIWGLGPGA